MCLCVCVFAGGSGSVHQRRELQWPRRPARPRPLPGAQWVQQNKLQLHTSLFITAVWFCSLTRQTDFSQRQQDGTEESLPVSVSRLFVLWHFETRSRTWVKFRDDWFFYPTKSILDPVFTNHMWHNTPSSANIQHMQYVVLCCVALCCVVLFGRVTCYSTCHIDVSISLFPSGVCVGRVGFEFSIISDDFRHYLVKY